MEAISKEVLRGIGKMARLKQQTRKWGGGEGMKYLEFFCY